MLGLALELLRRESRIGRMGLRIVIDFIRSTPVLVQLYFFYFVLPSIGLRLPAIAVGIWAIGLYYSGYLAEVFKAGIDAVPAGQWDGAKALGFSRLQTFFLIVGPQMLSKVAGPVCGYFISIFKTTPYLAVITVPDAFGAALDIATDSFRYTEPMVVAGCVFLLVALCMVHLTRRLELRLGVAQAR
jgi:polar amino acid transport system permease protein